MRKSPEMLVNMKEVPEWNSKLGYHDQKTTVRQFWDEERKKLTKGININGYKMHPWLYFHLNVFKTPIPQPDKSDKLMHPPLSDNEMLLADSLEGAQKNHKILALFGTRGFRKTTFISSHVHWTMCTKSQGIYSIIGGSAVDLKAISSLMMKTFSNVTPAFYLPTLSADWEDHIIFGVKDKSTSGRKYIHGEIAITNATENRTDSKEKGAGLSPIGFVVDEFGKFNGVGPLESALPSFRTPYGFRLTPIISGTSGDMDKAQYAREVLENPKLWSIYEFDYDRLSRGVPEEYRTWKNDKDKKFGTFVPAQMSSRLEGVPKVKSNLADYLNYRGRGLEDIPIQVTDWKKATEHVQEMHRLGESGKDEKARSNKMYHPLEIDDIFLSESKNPFPVEAITRTIKRIENEGLFGKPVTLYKEDGTIRTEYSDKKRSKVTHPGGPSDSPGYLFKEIPQARPEKYFYISGLDDYKTDISYTDSLGAFYVLQRANLELNTPCEKIVFSYVARPSRHEEFHMQVQHGIEAFNAECLMEAADTTFIGHLERQQKSWEYLTPALSFAPSAGKKNTKTQANKFGLQPTGWNNTYRMNVLQDWCWKRHTIGFDENDNPIEKLSVEFIEDIDLLKEMLEYRKGKNVDRIVAFSHALLRCKLLDNDNVLPKSLGKPKVVKQETSEGLLGHRFQTQKKENPYGKRRVKNPYGRRF